jgi:ribose transport system substrate-binding protein
MPGPDPWYAYAKDGFVFAAEKLGIETVVLNSDYDQEKEQTNTEDLITQKVDGINLFSFLPEGCQLAAQKTNKANIPMTIEMSGLGEGTGTVAADIQFDWKKFGEMEGEYISTNWPGEKVLIICGLLGQGPNDLYLSGVKEKLAAAGKNEIVDVQPADYNRQKAMDIMQNMLQSGKEFTVVQVGNEDMAMGVIQVLKDAGKLNNPIKVISNNGSPDGLKAIKDGDLSATVSTSPSMGSVSAFSALYRFVMGQKVPAQVFAPMFMVTKENVDKAIAWEVSDGTLAAVDEMFAGLGDFAPIFK